MNQIKLNQIQQINHAELSVRPSNKVHYFVGKIFTSYKMNGDMMDVDSFETPITPLGTNKRMSTAGRRRPPKQRGSIFGG